MSHFARGSVVAQQVARIRLLDREIESLKAQRQTYVDRITPLITSTGRQTVEGQDPFTVSANNTYNEAVILASLKPGQVKRVSVSKVDKPAVKRLYPEVYEASKVENGVKFSF
jgi:hypothetical protein